MDTTDRSVSIQIGGEEFRLILTTRATKEIAARYGGLENLGDKLMAEKNYELALSEVIWLIMILANQSVMIHNLQNPEDKRELLTEESLELLTTPSELVSHKEAIVNAMYKGTKRDVLSEETDEKNTQAG